MWKALFVLWGVVGFYFNGAGFLVTYTADMLFLVVTTLLWIGGMLFFGVLTLAKRI